MKYIGKETSCVEMFTGHGYRPYTWQKVKPGADKKGKLTAIVHEAVNNTSSFENYSDSATDFTKTIYACPNLEVANSEWAEFRRQSPTPFSTRPENALESAGHAGQTALINSIRQSGYSISGRRNLISTT